MTRHEFFDGVIVAMAGGSDEHNAITARLMGLCGLRVVAPCRPFSSDQRFWIAGARRARYSDGSIICGAPDHPPHDSQATTNPIIVFEVLSPSTDGDDEGEKRIDFQSLASLKAYILVAQDARIVKVYRRDAEGWSNEPEVYSDGGSFDLPSLSSPIRVAEIYDGVIDTNGQSLLV